LSAEELSNYNELLESSLFNAPEPFTTQCDENQENYFLNLTTDLKNQEEYKLSQ